jgi:hypothetical protein
MDQEQIAILAYRLWEERGCPDGSPELDWERAEILLRETEEVKPRPRREQVSARGEGSTASRH